VREERRTRFWCAKEATAKALGVGFVAGPQSITVVAWDERAGIATLEPGSGLSASFPHFAGQTFVAHTRRDGDYIVATSLYHAPGAGVLSQMAE
jgi:phosphopantetheinyl transferase